MPKPVVSEETQDIREAVLTPRSNKILMEYEEAIENSGSGCGMEDIEEIVQKIVTIEVEYRKDLEDLKQKYNVLSAPLVS